MQSEVRCGFNGISLCQGAGSGEVSNLVGEIVPDGGSPIRRITEGAAGLGRIHSQDAGRSLDPMSDAGAPVSYPPIVRASRLRSGRHDAS
jgi:hypothetical protein